VFLNADVDAFAYCACVVSKLWKLLEEEWVGLGLAGYHVFPQVVGDDVLDVAGSSVALLSWWMRTERTAMIGGRGEGSGGRRR
jgi:hypothetical protein